MIATELLRRFDLNGPRYTSYPTADRFSTAVGLAQLETALATRNTNPVSLYVHIPFCRSLCYYCACNKIVTKSNTIADQYLDSLIAEIKVVTAFTGRLPVAQLAFGGGTPNFLSLAHFERLFSALHACFDLQEKSECSIELDPRDVNVGYVAGLATLGINRVSIGIQDFDADVQRLIHRFQTFEQTRSVVTEARRCGIESVSFDLVYGLPTQSRERFATTLERALSLAPDRIAMFNYAHIPERFKAQRRIPTEALPSIEERTSLFLYAAERLVDAGYTAIGLDHFAKPQDPLARAANDGTLRRNFQGYSTHGGSDLIGLGVSAISQFENLFAQNSADLDIYRTRLAQGKLPTQRGVALTYDDRIRAYVIECIMCHGHVQWASVSGLFGIDAHAYFARELAALAGMQRDGIVKLSNDELRVTGPGRLLLRAVAMEFDAYRRVVSPTPTDRDIAPIRFSRIA